MDGSDVATLSFPKGTLLKLDVAQNGNLFSLQHTSSGSGKIDIYSPGLALISSITSDPEIPGSGFSNVSSFCMDAKGRMFVSTRYNGGGVITDYSTSVFTLPSTRVEYWAQQNITGGNGVFAVTDDRMYTVDGTDIYVRKEGSYEVLSSLKASLPKDPASTAAAVRDAKLGGNGKIYILVSGGILICQRTYRTAWETGASTPPVPAVVNIAQRYGTSLLDIDYKVVDPDSSSLTTAAVAFQDGTQSLDKLIRMNTLVEGTGSNVGAGKATNTTYRLTWDAAADFSTNFVNLAVTVLAKDDRDLLGLHFLTLPASGGDPELTINRSPVTQAELMPSWYWLTARNDLTGAVFSNSAVYATTWLPPASVTNGTAGISATYFNEVTWTGTSVSRIESQINYPTGTAWLPVGIDNTYFTVSWRAKFVAQATETLTFYTSTDDGAMLNIDGATIISKWSSQGMAESSGSINVTAGRTYDLEFGYYQNTGNYGAILRWSSPSIPKQVVPANRLFQSAPPLTPPYLLATGTHTTAAGRAYLWERLGVREATPAEILRVKEAGHPGTINRYDPRVKVGSHPEKVNEYGFDTGTSWSADSYFVVPLAP
ncbi:MAG: PA14 domain-containing protein [Kiritimatiellia bacterium]